MWQQRPFLKYLFVVAHLFWNGFVDLVKGTTHKWSTQQLSAVTEVDREGVLLCRKRRAIWKRWTKAECVLLPHVDADWAQWATFPGRKDSWLFVYDARKATLSWSLIQHD